MFEKVRRVESIIRWAREKLPHYGPVLRTDLHEFRGEIVRAAFGASIAAVAALLFAGFLSLAVIVTAWDGDYRIAAAWGVCLAWALLASAGLWFAWRATSGPPPFRHLVAELRGDRVDWLALLEAVD